MTDDATRDPGRDHEPSPALRHELDALLAAPPFDPGTGPIELAAVDTERAALARLEDLDDDRYWAAPASRATSAHDAVGSDEPQRSPRAKRSTEPIRRERRHGARSAPSVRPRTTPAPRDTVAAAATAAATAAAAATATAGSPPRAAGPATASPPTAGARLLRSNLVVAAGTTLSRVTGLVRTIVFGAVIGQTALADAYNIGNETPNIVYELLIGGVLSATLVPLFTSLWSEDDEDRRNEAVNAVFTVAMAAMAVLTLVAVVAAPAIFGIYTINVQGADADVMREVGTTLTRVFLLQIFFYGIAGLCNAYLNSRRRFFAAAWSPILANVIVIVTLLTLRGRAWELTDVLTDGRLRWTLSLGTTLGIAAMAAVLVPSVRAAGLRWRPVFQPRHPAVRRLLTMSAWTLGYVIANQVALVVIRNLSDPGTGDSTAYFQAFTFFVLPHGLLAMSVATTFVPEMARSVAAKDRAGFSQRASLGIRVIALLTVPAGFVMFALRRPIIGLFMQHGEFTSFDALRASRALGGFAIGLVGFSVYLFTLRGFYAHQDTRTPFVINVGQNIMNIVFAIVFVRWWGILGLAAALALSYVLAAGWAIQVLTYKVRGFPVREVVASLGRIVVAGALAGEAAWLIGDQVGGNTGWAALGRLLVGGVTGVVVYLALLMAQKAPELDAVRRLVRQRRSRSPQPAR